MSLTSAGASERNGLGLALPITGHRFLIFNILNVLLIAVLFVVISDQRYGRPVFSSRAFIGKQAIFYVCVGKQHDRVRRAVLHDIHHATSPENHATESAGNILNQTISVLTTGDLGVDCKAFFFAAKAIINLFVAVATDLIKLAKVNH